MVIAMTTESHKPKTSLLKLVSNVSPDQWEERLDDACQGDDELRNRVRALLRAHAEPGSFPGATRNCWCVQQRTMIRHHRASRHGHRPVQAAAANRRRRHGRRLHGRADQPIQRTVALKIIKPGMDTRQVIARFEAERQALAMMDHPNIAKVLDAGTTDSGRPYFVMELVKGVPITKYCDDKHLPLRERLELFVPVCQAVQHAHQKGIIHRDIKPSQRAGRAVRRQAGPQGDRLRRGQGHGAEADRTDDVHEFGQVVGTLEYMSPEQAKFNQLDIDTRSDIYSLGVLLYELLTGTTPFERQAAAGGGVRRNAADHPRRGAAQAEHAA